MRSDSLRAGFASLTGLAIATLAACGGGDGTAPLPDDEAAQQAAAAERAPEASAEFEQLVAAGNPDPVGALVASLQADPALAEVERLDEGGSVLAKLNGVPFGVLVSQQNRSEWTAVGAGGALGALPGGAGNAGGVFSGQAAAPPIACDPTNFPQSPSKKACVLRTLDFELFGGESSIEQSLQRAGFEIAPLLWPTRAEEIVQLQQTLSSCGVLYILAHGAVNENLEDTPTRGNHLITDVEVSDEPKFLAALQVLGPAFPGKFKQFFGLDSHDGKSYLTISPAFFGSVQYPNTLVFVNGCSSDAPVAGGTQLRDAFRTNGAGAFVGWKVPVPSALASTASDELFDALAPKVANIDAVTVTATPPDPGPGESYVPSASIAPAQAGVEVSLTVRGTDGYTQDETGTTDASGQVTFASVPGGEGEVIDSITVVAGGASNSATALNAILNSPTLQAAYVLPWLTQLGVTINALTLDARSADFNLACNNQKLVQKVAVVKF